VSAALDLFPVALPTADAALHRRGGSEAAPVVLELEVEEETTENDSAPEAAADAEPSPVGIYEVTAGTTTYRWLCAPHVVTRKAGGWNCKRTGNLPSDFTCDDCVKERNGQG
jgi:hypothetical protein